MKLSERQQEIIGAALRLTSLGGIQNLTIKNLAGELGITEPAIYRHFRNKSEIVKTMIANFESGAANGIMDSPPGLAGIETFVKSRFALVKSNPSLARVMFSEELFMDDPSYSALLLEMMHRHKNALQVHFLDAQRAGEIRGDIAVDILFRLVFGPVRLLVKQWGMSGEAFDLIAAGDELWAALEKTLAGTKLKQPNQGEDLS